jgi:DNA-binding HxlR family transcriptional regulator
MSTETTQRSECVFSNFLDLLGDKWTLLIVRDLMFFGKHEYKEFLASPESIATNILSDRLKKLVAANIVDERVHPENKSRKFYYLTGKGKALLPTLIEMAKWGAVYFPDLERMQGVYARLRANPQDKLRAEVLKKLSAWELENLS